MPEHTATPARTRYGTRDLLTTFGQDRTCQHDGCGTRLSRYNQDEVCAAHADA